MMEHRARLRQELVLLAALATLAPLVYVLYTQHVWEDYFITFRHSQNLAEGRGLVYQEGERVHGFTSPLGVLLPALFHWTAGRPQSYQPALWCFRILSIAAFAASAVLLFQTVRSAAPQARIARWTAALLYLLEIKGVAYSTNGQETGILLFFLAWTLYLQQRGLQKRWFWGGIAWAGLQWTRPDGCILIAATGLTALTFPGASRRRDVLAALAKMSCVTTVLYAPWFFFAWWYYGSPIPHTVVAKAMGWGHEAPLSFLGHAAKTPKWVLDPICAFFPGWPSWLLRPTRAAGFVGLMIVLLPLSTPVGLLARRASFVYVLLVCYLDCVVAFYWYMPPAALCLLLSLGCSLQAAPRTMLLLFLAAFAGLILEEEQRLLPGHHLQNTLLIGVAVIAATWRVVPQRWVGLAASLGLAGCLSVIAALSTVELRVQQQVIESGNRQLIGEWLAANVKPEETIYLECLGYIGYFSNGKMRDFPGLVSPEVVAARKRTGADLAGVIPLVKPDWLVLRPFELAAAKNLQFVRAHYLPQKEFSVADRLDREYSWLPGLGYLKCDSCFTILKRIDPPEASRAALMGN